MTGCYILHSQKLNKFYVGATQEDVANRIIKHNSQFYGKNRFTAKADDWILQLFIPSNDYSQAIRIERKIKAMKSAVFIKKIIQDKGLLAQLVSST